MTIETKDYISIAALIISVISLYFSRFDKRINLGARLNFDGDIYTLDIYNNSNRHVTISYIDIFGAKSEKALKRDSATTWYDGSNSPNFVIKSHESTNIEFEGPYELNGFISRNKGNNIYLTLFVSGKRNKTMKIY
jgi:hypothetical protein